MARSSESDAAANSNGAASGPAGQEYLEVRGPAGAVQRVELSGRRLAFGRAADAQVRLVADTISRYHAELFCDDFGRWWVHDLGSHNGTRLNGRRVSESILRPGDAIEIGPFAIRLHLAVSAVETTRGSSQRPVSISDAKSGPITSLGEGAVPKIAATHLSRLMAFGRQMMDVPESADRLRGLCRLMIGDEFGGWSAMVMRIRKDLPGDLSGVASAKPEALAKPEPPEMVCGPESRPEHQRMKPYVSRSVLEAVRQRGEPILASNAAQESVDVEMSLPGAVTALSALACPLNSGSTMDLLYVVLPPQFGTREWLALASLAVEEFQHVEATWAACRQAEANAAIEQELEQARRIQMRLVPQAVSVAGWDVALEFTPCRWVGGDYVDVVPMPDGRTLLAVADVCGKGLQAALVAATVHSLVHASLRTGVGLADMMRILNEHLCEYLPENSFVTMLVAAVGLPAGNAQPGAAVPGGTAALRGTAAPGCACGGEIECVNAGHPPLMVVAPDGQVRQCEAGGHLPLGFGPISFQSCREPVARGDLLAMYTDGVTDIAGVTGEKVGLKHLGEQLASAYACGAGGAARREPLGRATAREVAERLKAYLQQVQGGSLPVDDCTYLLARRLA
jgi:serine phosphatase RsbU (regulator of sigma subunit)/pSer/pThr/pTyr-binding forkhead associated (FHA) protein